jgi:hypothetical protein
MWVVQKYRPPPLQLVPIKEKAGGKRMHGMEKPGSRNRPTKILENPVGIFVPGKD